MNIDSNKLEGIPLARLPKDIRDQIYKLACGCKCTEEQAQKEPCLCAAYGLVEQIEDWAEKIKRENNILRAAILEFTGELTDEQLEYHEADPPYENSRPEIARLYRIATS